MRAAWPAHFVTHGWHVLRWNEIHISVIGYKVLLFAIVASNSVGPRHGVGIDSNDLENSQFSERGISRHLNEFPRKGRWAEGIASSVLNGVFCVAGPWLVELYNEQLVGLLGSGMRRNKIECRGKAHRAEGELLISKTSGHLL